MLEERQEEQTKLAAERGKISAAKFKVGDKGSIQETKGNRLPKVKD